jgi:neutral ceramidase
MRFIPALTFVVVCIAAVSFASDSARTADGPKPKQPAFKAGFADRDITPELGMEQPGGYSKSFHKTLHDPCKVRAAVFDDGQTRVAIVGLDALALRSPSVEAARQAIQQQCGIPPHCVLISASHSHSSGPTAMILPGEYDHASPVVQALAYEKSSCANPQYLKKVEAAIVEAVCAADRTRVEADCGVGFGVEDKVAFNRRFRMRSGMTATHPGQGNPDIIEVAGPIDPQVGVIGAWDKQGKLLGAIVNYACHATTSPGGISANYICYLEKAIRGMFGPETVVVFLPGACGDVTQVDNLNPHLNRSGERSAEFVGGRIGAEAIKVLLSMERGSLAPLAAKHETLKIARRLPSQQRVERSRALVQEDPKKVGMTEWVFAKEIVLLDARGAKEPIADVEVQAIQVGPAVFLTDPAEFFCDFGLQLKAKSPFPFTFPVSLANDCIGYVPTAEALGPHGGGYETRLTSYSNLIPSAGQTIVDADLNLTKTMRPAAPPEAAKAPPYKSWNYGDVPPELD